MLIRRHAPQRRWPTWLIAGILLIYTPTVQAQHEDRPITLQAAIARSLEAGTHVRRAGARHEAALAASGPLSSEYIPSARVTASSTLSQYPLTVTPIREQGVFPPLDDQIQEVSFNLSWTVFDFGQGRAARRSAQALAEAAGVEYDLARMETVERVTTAYVHLAHLTSIRDAQQDRLDALNERRAELTALHDEGRVPDVELLRIAEVVLSAETDLRKTRNDVASVLLELSGTLNMPETLDIEDIALFPLVAAKASPAAVDPAASPRVTLARKTLEAARFSAREADRSSFPAIELFAAERLRAGSDFSFDDDLYGGIRLSVPLFQPRQQVLRQVERATVNEREEALIAAEREFANAARDLANREREAYERSVANEARVRHLEETYRIEAAVHEEGRLTLSDLLDTEGRLAAARGELAAAKALAITIRLQRDVLAGTLTPSSVLHLIGKEE